MGVKEGCISFVNQYRIGKRNSYLIYDIKEKRKIKFMSQIWILLHEWMPTEQKKFISHKKTSKRNSDLICELNGNLKKGIHVSKVNFIVGINAIAYQTKKQ